VGSYTIRKGLDLQLEGAPEGIVDAVKPSTIAVCPPDFKGLKPRVVVSEGDAVRGGDPLFESKSDNALKFVTPVGGTVKEVVIGERRKVLSIIIEPDWKGESRDFGTYSESKISSLSRDDAVAYLKETGTFAFIRQRPFNKIPDSTREPKSIFITAMDSAPNSIDHGALLKDKIKELQLAALMLGNLTSGKVHLCCSEKDKELFSSLKGVELHTFKGPHPSGLVGTHIHFVDPIIKGDIVWYADALHMVTLGALLKTGKWDPQRYVCVAGSAAPKPAVYKSWYGAPVANHFGQGLPADEIRIISGTVLYGDTVSESAYLNFYSNNLQVIPEGRTRHFLGLMAPGADYYSASANVFLSAFLPSKKWNFTTNQHGGKRAIVWTDVYDKVMPLHIYTTYLIRALSGDDIEEAEKLGLLETAEEDFALATYICPSKTDVAGLVGKGLESVEREGY